MFVVTWCLRLWLVCVFSVMWSELLMTSAISCPQWSSVVISVRVPDRGVCVYISGED